VGVMGGLAASVEKRLPTMAAAYRAACRDGVFELGGVLVWYDEVTGVWIYNLATQEQPGPDARLEAIATSIDAALTHAAEQQVDELWVPRIGAGIGGLKWADVRAVLATAAADHPDVDVVVITPR
jgi:O-acetyl-ADP-ribose deacetylase (regulator of RNase III)